MTHDAPAGEVFGEIDHGRSVHRCDLIHRCRARGRRRAAADAANGKRIFGVTRHNCHSSDIGVNKIGPSLHAVVNRKAASAPDFNYSALSASDVVRNEPELDVYLSNPRGTIHDVKMWFKGLSDPHDRADVIA
jgi:cytochrome c